MSEVLKVRFEDLEVMRTHCLNTAKRLQETIKLAQTISTQMQNGALIGDAGTAFSEALKGPFIASVTRLSEKFEEVAKDIADAAAKIKAEDTKAGQQFTN